MASPGSNRPRMLRAPYGGNTGSVEISVDLGAFAPLADVTGRIDDLSTLVDVGHRWGIELARSAAEWDLEFETERGDPRELEDPSRPTLQRRRDRQRRKDHDRMVWEYHEFGPSSPDPEWVALRDVRAGQLLGQSATVRQLQYSNPIELVLMGSGMLMAGVVVAARLVRDWSATRRTNEAVAREANAEARMTEARAQLYSWMVDEARRGQSPIPIGDLVQIVTPPEVKALTRLSQDPVSLQLPRGSE